MAPAAIEKSSLGDNSDCTNIQGMLQEEPCTQNGHDALKKSTWMQHKWEWQTSNGLLPRMVHCKLQSSLKCNAEADDSDTNMHKSLHIEINHLLEHTKIGTDQDGDAIDDIAKVDEAKTAHKHVCAFVNSIRKI